MTTDDSWQMTMYDRDFANASINSPDFFASAKAQVDFLVRELALTRGARLLDVPCGTGRHVRYFAEAGLDVTGLDINAELLREAEKNCRGQVGSFACADMRSLEEFRGYDATVNLFTSFGYFATDEDNERVLGQMVATLKPGGALVLNLIDRVWLTSVFKPVSIQESASTFVMEAREFDPVSNYNVVNTIRMDKVKGTAKRYYHRVRLYEASEILAMCARQGLRDVRVFGDFDGRAYEKGVSSHPIFVAIR